jgi:pimeloyl-ACP methyl ester carboxylesterase
MLTQGAPGAVAVAAGKPILFVHGMWHGGWCYEEHFIPWFRNRGYDARAVTLRHHEVRFARGVRTTRIRHFVEDLATAAAAFPSAPVVVGHSMGGFVTQKYLEEHDAPAAVLLAPAPPGGILGASARLGFQHPLRLLAAKLTLSLYQMVKTPERARELLFSTELDEASVARYQAKLTEGAAVAYLEMLGITRANVANIRARGVPILVLHGDEDRSISQSDTAATVRAYDAEVRTFAGQGHDLMLDVGWEQVALAIDEFVQRRVPALSARSQAFGA